MSSQMAEVEVPQEAVKVGLLCGLMKVAPDGVTELTPDGERWLRSWCAEQRASVAATEAGDE